jgi:hypothetical protein
MMVGTKADRTTTVTSSVYWVRVMKWWSYPPVSSLLDRCWLGRSVSGWIGKFQVVGGVLLRSGGRNRVSVGPCSVRGYAPCWLR